MSMSKERLDQIVDAIHAQPELTGVVVGLYDGLLCSVASSGSMVAMAFREKAVIVELIGSSGDSVEVPDVPTDMSQPPGLITNRSRVWSELAGAGLNCSFAVISGVGVLGSAAGEVPTAGASTFLLIVAWTGFVTTGIQCINGVVRTVEAVRAPDSDSLARWDQSKIYTMSFLIVDAVGIGAAVLTAPAAVKNLLGVLERRGGMASSQKLAAMGREARAKEIQSAMLKARQNVQSAKELEQALKDALSAKTLRRVAAGNVVVASRNAGTINKVITDETARRLERAILDIVGVVDSPIASGLPSTVVGSASGSVNALGGQIIHVVGLDAG